MYQIFPVLVFLFISPFIRAEFGGNIHILQSVQDAHLTTVTGVYHWSHKRCSGFGFYDRFDRTPFQYVTENSFDCNLSDRVYASVEISDASFGSFQKAGIGFRLVGENSALSNIFIFLDATVYAKAWNNDDRQLKLTWMTRKWRLTDRVSIYSSGFGRFKDGDLPNLFQPQVWFSFKDSPIEVGTEIAFVDSDETYQAAIKTTSRILGETKPTEDSSSRWVLQFKIPPQ